MDTCFKSWLAEMLQRLGVDSDMYTDYIVGIMEQEENTVEENARTTREFLSALADISEDFQNTLIEKFTSSKKKKLEKSVSRTSKDEDAVSKTIREAREFASKRQKAAEASKQERKRLIDELGLEEYLYVSEDILTDDKEEEKDVAKRNVNRRRVEEEVRRKREIQKKKSKIKKERDKADLARDKARKEKRLAEARKRASKGERRKKR